MGSTDAMPQERVLVTAAAHGLGELIWREARKVGFYTIGIDQKASTPSSITTEDELRLGDYSDPEFLHRALEGVRHIIHTATDRRPRLPYEQLATGNIELSKRLFEAAAEVGCKSFLYLSSARICAPTGRYLAEDSKVEATNAYEQTLYDAEILLRGMANRAIGGPRLIILRCAAVYGDAIPPQGSPWLAIPPILSLAFNLIPGIAGGPRTHWVHAADVARAAIHLIALDSNKPVETYHLADDTPLSVGEFINRLIEAYGYSLGVKVPFPTPTILAGLLKVVDNDLLLQLLDRLLSRMWRSVREYYSITEEYWPALSPESLSTVLKDTIISNDRIKSSGFTLQYPDVRLGIQDLIQDCQSRKILPDPRPEIQQNKNAAPTYWTSFTENLRGACFLEGKDQKTSSVALSARIASPEIHLPMRADLWTIDGVLTVEGLAHQVPIEGTLELSLLSRRKLLYQFVFTGDDGQQYRFEGSKRFSLRQPVYSLTRIQFSIVDRHGRIVARGEARWDPRQELVEFARNIQVQKVRG
ncbi:MAG: NAD(P)-dependent oxidoreductase [Bradymonadales bacterium]|nr:NAD(P)-dependent oxidoreductase [Bradymonadales bacterium]